MTEVDATASASRRFVDRYARWTGLLAGALVAYWLIPLDHGDGILYAIPAFGLCAVAGVLVGDALTQPTRGAVRTAGLAPRRVRDYVPPRMTWVLIAMAVVLVLLLGVAAAVASPDDVGRASRALTMTCRGGTASFSPWPGLHYGLPILACLAVATGACGWSLRRIATRPGDEQSRRDRSLAIVAAWGLVVSSSLFGTTAVTSGVLMDSGCGEALWIVARWVLWPLSLVAFVTVALMLSMVCAPRATWRRRSERRVRR
ncbi:hypothetical protein [Streptomyces sp. NPDC001435]|uniref:hypothetical protein n=1 Tax=Streptomyces sp. NPDC001435 TaxID=3364576 RepID=UPI0036B1430E